MKAKTKINVPPEFNLPADAPNAACLAIFNREDGAMFRILISEKEFDDLWRQSIQPGALTLPEFIAAAIREKVERDAAPLDSLELENATAANNALMQLLVENMEFCRQDSGASSFAGGGESGTLCFGVFQLVDQCRTRLKKAMEGAS